MICQKCNTSPSPQISFAESGPVISACCSCDEVHNQPLPISQDEIHELAVSKGWWPQDIPDQRIPEALALIHSEISEALEDWRNGHAPNEIYYEGQKPCGFGIELADTVIRLRDLAAATGLDLEELVRIKHEYNKTRPFRHGGKKI